MNRFGTILILLFCCAAFGQVTKSGSTRTSGSAQAAGTTFAADADWLARSNSTGVQRAITFSAGLPTWTGNPIGGAFPDAWHSNGFATYDVSDKLRSTGGSIKFSQPADGTNDLQSVADNGGSAWFNVKPDTSVTFGSGTEFYIQWRSKKSPEWMAYNDATQGEQFKDYIASFSDRYIDSSNWASMYDCSAGEIVQVDNQRTLMPVLYYGCGAMAGKSFENLFPLRSGQQIDQTGPGCLHNNTVNAPTVNISSIQRVGNTVTVVTSTAHGLTTGNEVKVRNVPMANPTSTSNTSFDGVFTITVDSTTQFHYTQQGADQGPITSTGVVAKIDRSKCWVYQPNEWATYQLHVKIGSDYDIDNNYHRDTTVELWAAHENQPSVLVTSLTDYDFVMHEEGNVIQTAAPSVSGTVGRQAWWTNHGLQPAYGRMELMQYLSNRCALAHSVSGVGRTGTTAKVYFSGTRNYNNGAGSQCVNVGDQLVVAGTTIDGGSFNGTWTVTSASTFWATFTQTGNAVTDNTSDTGTVSLPKWNINCLGGPCVVDQHVDQVIWSTNRIPDPKVGVVSPTPNPPDHLQVTGVNASIGDVTVQWKCNDTSATGYKIYAAAADRYAASLNLGLGTGNQWTFVKTISKTCTTYGTQSATIALTADIVPVIPSATTSTLLSFRVYATNANGDSTWSNAAQNTPGQPTNITATSDASGHAVISWTKAVPSFETGFVVERCTGTANTSPCLSNTETGWTVVCGGTLAAGTVTCTDSTTSAGTNYVYRVKAVNNAGETLPWGGDPSFSLAYGGNTAVSQVTPSIASIFAPACSPAPCVTAVTGQGGLGTRLYSGSDGTGGGKSIATPNAFGGVEAPSSTAGVAFPWASSGNGNGDVGFYRNWSALIADTRRFRADLWANGGHAGGVGNEIFSLRFDINPPELIRASNPTYPMAAVQGQTTGGSSPASLPVIPISQYQCISGSPNKGHIVAATNFSFTCAHCGAFVPGKHIFVTDTGPSAYPNGGVDTDASTLGEGNLPTVSAVAGDGSWLEFSGGTWTCTPGTLTAAGTNPAARASIADQGSFPNTDHAYGNRYYDYLNDVGMIVNQYAPGINSGSLGAVWIWDNLGSVNSVYGASGTCSNTATYPASESCSVNNGGATTPHVYMANATYYIGNDSTSHPAGLKATTPINETFIDDDGAKDGTNTGENYVYILETGGNGKLWRFCANAAALGCTETYLTSFANNRNPWFRVATNLSTGCPGWITDGAYAQIDPHDGVLIYAGSLGTKFMCGIRLSDGQATTYTDAGLSGTSCNTMFASGKAPGFAWDPVALDFFGVREENPSVGWTITVDAVNHTLSCSQITFSGTGPTPPTNSGISNSNGGTHGLLKYFPHQNPGDSGDFFTWMGDALQNAFIFRIR